MTIITPGIKKGAIDIPKRFSCKNCKCVFEANAHEYFPTTYLAQVHDNLPGYFCVCPNCSLKVYTN